MSDQTYVYRLTNVEGVLLYVGVADEVGRRFHQHAKLKFWWTEVTNIDLEAFPTRDEALAAERKAIINEKPRHNVVHNAEHDGRDGSIRWYCHVCLLEITSGGQMVLEWYKSREHLRVNLMGVAFWKCPEAGLLAPYHDRCVSVDMNQQAEDGKSVYRSWEIDPIRSRLGLMRWMADLVDVEAIGGSYAWHLLEQALGTEREEYA